MISLNIDRKILAELIVFVALASVLHLIRPFSLPQGGSITAGAMIPIMLFSLRRGYKNGLLAGIIFGLIVFVQEPFFFHPVQWLLDYPIAFGLLGLAGIARKYYVLGIGLAMFGRFISHFLSGIIFFASYTPEGMSPIIYSIIYNGSFLSIEFAISAVILYALFKRKIFKIYQ